MAHGATGRLTLLRRNRAFALLFWATAGSAVGTYLAALALSVDILDRTDSGSWLAALLIAVAIVTWTMGPRRRKPPRDSHENAPGDADRDKLP